MPQSAPQTHRDLRIRDELPGEEDAIASVLRAAFETPGEERLVEALRASGAIRASMVAELDGRPVAYIAFSEVTVTDADGRTSTGLGLGPMAVLPGLQGLGVGGRLLDASIAAMQGGAYPFCVVLGHPDYYARHGFELAAPRGIRWEHPVPDDVFFVRELREGGLEGVRGVVRYRPEFDAV